MTRDAVTVAPHVHKVIFENKKVRILDTVLKLGEKTEMHSHPDLVAVGISNGKYKYTFPTGKSMEVEFNAGDSIFKAAVEHATENIGSDVGRTILVELK